LWRWSCRSRARGLTRFFFFFFFPFLRGGRRRRVSRRVSSSSSSTRTPWRFPPPPHPQNSVYRGAHAGLRRHQYLARLLEIQSGCAWPARLSRNGCGSWIMAPMGLGAPRLAEGHSSEPGSVRRHSAVSRQTGRCSGSSKNKSATASRQGDEAIEVCEGSLGSSAPIRGLCAIAQDAGVRVNSSPSSASADLCVIDLQTCFLARPAQSWLRWRLPREYKSRAPPVQRQQAHILEQRGQGIFLGSD